MQKILLLLTIIISRVVPSPISQFGQVDSFDPVLPDSYDSGIDAPETFQVSSSEISPQDAPVQTPPNVPQPGDPAFKQVPPLSPGKEPPVRSKQPFSCAPGKSGACCIGGSKSGVTSGCISYVPWDDWCQNQDAYKCCKAEPEKEAAIAAGTLADDHFREDCEDPKEVEWTTQQKFQNLGNSILHMITPEVNPVLSFPKPVWIPNQ